MDSYKYEKTFSKNGNLMKQKLFLTVAMLVLILLSVSLSSATEININWRQKLDSGKVYDLKFMPGQESFVLVTDYFLEVRSCEDGLIMKSVAIPYIGAAHNIEFTPDSTKLILAYADKIEIREIENFSLINSYTIPEEEEFSIRFYEMIVDPVRPFIYALWIKTKGIHSTFEEYDKILIFDRETLQPIGELTNGNDTNLRFKNIAVSKDGKYLAAMNYGVSKLIVWSLDTRQKIVDKYISDPSSKEFSEPADIKFSELNSDKVFFTGQFFQREGKETLEGLCIFSISENRIIDSTFATGVNSGIAHIAFFEYGQKIFLGGYMIKFINLNDMRLEYKRKYNENNILINAGYPIYNEKKKFFLGYNPGGI